MIILITGIHGFVGSNLVSGHKEQHTIYGLDIVSPQKDGVLKTFGWNELEQIPAIDLIIHLAGKAHDTKRGGDYTRGEKGEGETGRLESASFRVTRKSRTICAIGC